MVHVLAGAALLALGGLSALLAVAIVQNRDLPARLRATGRPVAQVLRRSLALWSPLGAAVLLFVVVANAIGAMSLALAYRATPLDEWCVVENAEGRPAIPCTGLPRILPAASMVRASHDERVRDFVLDRHLEAIERIRLAPTGTAASRDARKRASAAATLGLPESPLDDGELLRMRRELRQLLDTPVAPAANMLDRLRVRGETEIRDRRLRELTAQVRARRKALSDAAYAGRPRQEQARLWLQHRIAHGLAAGEVPAGTVQGWMGTDDASARAALAAKSAQDAAWSLEWLERDAVNGKARAAQALALQLPEDCVSRLRPSKAFPCPRLVAGAQSLRLRQVRFGEAVRLSIDRWHEQSRRAALLELGRLGLDVRRGAVSAAEAVDALERSLPARIAFAREPCAWNHAAGCADNLARTSLEQALRAGSRRALAPLHPAVARAGDAAASFGLRVGEVALSLGPRMEALRGQAQDGAYWTLTLHRILAAAGWVLLAFVALRSWLYVLGLEAFRHGGPATLGFDDAPPVQGEVRIGRRLTLDPDFPGALVTRKQLSNSDNHLRLAPWPWSAPIARLFRGRYLLYTRGRFLSGSGEAGAGQGRIASADAGRAIVEWRMQPGEEVVFGWREFFGASENLRLRTRWSLRLSTLLMGRVIFRIAQCPAGGGEGRLLLKADVEQVEQSRLHALPPERLLAWNRQVRFRAHGAESAWGVLVHGCTLVREPAAGGLVLATSADAAPGFGTLRYLRRLLRAVF